MKCALLASIFLCSTLLAQPYTLPNNNAGCPTNCRLITWQAGSDIWHEGTLPSYSQVTCSPLHEDGSTDDATDINNCITAANAGTGAYTTCHAGGGCAVYLPPGTIYVNGTVRLKNNVVLRGAGSSDWTVVGAVGVTQINLGASGSLDTQNFSWGTNLNPGTSYSTLPSTFSLTGSPQKGDSTVTIGSGSVIVGTWIKIFGNDDPTLVDSTGTDGYCQWCGDNTGYYVMQQFVQITGFISGSGSAGSVANINPPLYYAPDTTARTVNGQSEPSGAKYNIITFPTQYAGYESFKVTATGDIGATPIIRLQGCLYCWAKGVETQTTGGNSEGVHLMLMASYGDEIRDSYFHDQRSGASGSGYGVYFEWVNGDHKVENNVIRHNRHGIVYQGGGSGTAVLYNYIDDEYTDDLTYNGSARTSHGAHPFFNLFEGNIISHIAADDFWGTSSHDVFFRNWIWGDYTGTWTLPSPGTDQAAPSGSNPANGFDGVDLYQNQEYYAFVGNVLGKTGGHATWSGATLSITCSLNNCGYETRTNPGVYSYGNVQMHSGGVAALSSATILRHGNYDYKTNGVAFWDGGANHILQTSMYYLSEPGFEAGYAWPIAGPDLVPLTNINAAMAKYSGIPPNEPSGSGGAGPTRSAGPTFGHYR